MSKHQWIIWYAAFLHWIWGATLISTSIPLGVTAISTIINIGLVTGNTAGIFYLMIASLAAIGALAPKPAGTFFLLPQTGVLWLAAYGALLAMARGSFADGVIRPTSFLLTDQAPAVLAAIFHTAAVVESASEIDNPPRPQFTWLSKWRRD